MKSHSDGLNDTAIAVEAKCSVITKSKKKIHLQTKKKKSLHHNAASSSLYAKGVKIHQFKAKGSERKPYPLRLGNISKDFTVDNMKKQKKKKWKDLRFFSWLRDWLRGWYLMKNTKLYKCLDSLSKLLLFWCWCCSALVDHWL